MQLHRGGQGGDFEVLKLRLLQWGGSAYRGGEVVAASVGVHGVDCGGEIPEIPGEGENNQ